VAAGDGGMIQVDLNGFRLGYPPIGSHPTLLGQIRLTSHIRLHYMGARPRTAGPWHRPAAPRRRRAHGEADWAKLMILPKSRIQIRKPFSFSNLFYKLQINLN
jgi:hypothetical protein